MYATGVMVTIFGSPRAGLHCELKEKSTIMEYSSKLLQHLGQRACTWLQQLCGSPSSDIEGNIACPEVLKQCFHEFLFFHIVNISPESGLLLPYGQ